MDGYARFCRLPGSPQSLYANAGVMGSGWETTDFTSGSLVYIGTIAFRHKYVTINGAKYLFVKEYEVKKSLWLR